MNSTFPPIPPQGAGYPRGRLRPTPIYGFRFLAFLIDFLPFFALYVVLLALLFLPMRIDNFEEKFQDFMEATQTLTEEEMMEREDLRKFLGEVASTVLITFPLLLFAWFFGLEQAFKGGSFGKRIFRLRVYHLPTKSPTRQSVSFGRALVKTACVFYPVSGAPLHIVVAFGILLFPLLNKRRQALHDLLSKTMVFQDDWVVQQNDPTPSSPPPTDS